MGTLVVSSFTYLIILRGKTSYQNIKFFKHMSKNNCFLTSIILTYIIPQAQLKHKLIFHGIP